MLSYPSNCSASKDAETPPTRPITLEDIPDPDGGGEAMPEKLHPAKIRQTKSAIWDTSDKDSGARTHQQSTKPRASVAQGKVREMVRFFDTSLNTKGLIDLGSHLACAANPSQLADTDSRTSEETDRSSALDEETESNAKNCQPEQELTKTKTSGTRKDTAVKPVPRHSLKIAPRKAAAAAAANTDATLKSSRNCSTDSQPTDIPDHDSTRRTDSRRMENRTCPRSSSRQRQGPPDSTSRSGGPPPPPKREDTITTKSSITTRCGGIQVSGGKTGRTVSRPASRRSSADELQELVNINSAVHLAPRSPKKLQIISGNNSTMKRKELVKADKKTVATEEQDLTNNLPEEAIDRYESAVQEKHQTNDQLSSFAVVQPVKIAENWKLAIGFVVTIAVLVICILYIAMNFMTTAESN